MAGLSKEVAMHKDDPRIKQKLAQIYNHRRHAKLAEDRAYMLLEDAQYSYEHIARLNERSLVTAASLV
jgi:hypothetical protein